MGERLYMFLLGGGVITGLYFEIPYILYAIIVINVIDGIFNLRLERHLNKLPLPGFNRNVPAFQSPHTVRIPFDAPRMWHLTVACVLTLSYVLYPKDLWFLVWFVGFAVAGAGLSGICPMLITLQKIGFR